MTNEPQFDLAAPYEIADEPIYQPSTAVVISPVLQPDNAGASPNLNSLELADEELHIDETASAFDFPPPPPEAGNPYLARLVRGERGQVVAFVNMDKAVPLAAAAKLVQTGAKIRHITDHVEIRLQANKDGATAFRPSSGRDPVGFDNASTAPYGGSCRAAGILREGLGRPLPATQTHRTIAAALWDVLATNPLCRVVIQWKAYCKQCDQEVRGERNFPQTVEGKRKSVVPCPKCGNDLPANWQPTRYLPA